MSESQVLNQPKSRTKMTMKKRLTQELMYQSLRRRRKKASPSSAISSASLAHWLFRIAAILIFQGCFLLNTRLTPTDDCPDDPVDCFVFNGTSATPLSESPSFHCDPQNTTQFPLGLSNGVAHCFRWIFARQTTKKILDQLGVCTGLLGLFATLLAIVVYLGKSIKSLLISHLFLACIITAIVLLPYYKWSYTPLTYAVLCVCSGLVVFGLILFCILPKPEKKPVNEV